MVTKKDVKTKKVGTEKDKKSVKSKIIKKKSSSVKTKKKVPSKKIVAKKMNKVSQTKKEEKKSIKKKNPENSYFAKWSAPEHVISKEDLTLYYIAIALSIIAIAWYFMQGSFVVVMTFSVLLVVILLQIVITPREIEYMIDLDGISFGNILHRYSDVDSFEVEVRENANILKIKSNSAFLPIKEINLGNQDPYYIRAVLENFLTEKNLEATLFSFGKTETEDEYFSDEELEEFIEKTEKKKKK
ncbi:MAG: hypothetical protein KAI57_04470 [Candidatus Pacebacteria bacterium]|nr:hypothetical protein [Candidatus Paceibacterota bacterium]